MISDCTSTHGKKILWIPENIELIFVTFFSWGFFFTIVHVLSAFFVATIKVGKHIKL